MRHTLYSLVKVPQNLHSASGHLTGLDCLSPFGQEHSTPVNLLYLVIKTISGPAHRRTVTRITACGLPSLISDYRFATLQTLFPLLRSVEMRGFEPLTSAVQRRRSPN